MTVGKEPKATPEAPLQHGTPEYVQRYAKLAGIKMGADLRRLAEADPNHDPEGFLTSSVVTQQALVMYVRGPLVPNPDVNAGGKIPAFESVKVHTHPGASGSKQGLGSSSEFSLPAGRTAVYLPVTAQRGFDTADTNLTPEELRFLQIQMVQVENMVNNIIKEMGA